MLRHIKPYLPQKSMAWFCLRHHRLPSHPPLYSISHIQKIRLHRLPLPLHDPPTSSSSAFTSFFLVLSLLPASVNTMFVVRMSRMPAQGLSLSYSRTGLSYCFQCVVTLAAKTSAHQLLCLFWPFARSEDSHSKAVPVLCVSASHGH